MAEFLGIKRVGLVCVLGDVAGATSQKWWVRTVGGEVSGQNS